MGTPREKFIDDLEQIKRDAGAIRSLASQGTQNGGPVIQNADGKPNTAVLHPGIPLESKGRLDIDNLVTQALARISHTGGDIAAADQVPGTGIADIKAATSPFGQAKLRELLGYESGGRVSAVDDPAPVAGAEAKFDDVGVIAPYKAKVAEAETVITNTIEEIKLRSQALLKNLINNGAEITALEWKEAFTGQLVEFDRQIELLKTAINSDGTASATQKALQAEKMDKLKTEFRQSITKLQDKELLQALNKVTFEGSVALRLDQVGDTQLANGTAAAANATLRSLKEHAGRLALKHSNDNFPAKFIAIRPGWPSLLESWQGFWGGKIKSDAAVSTIAAPGRYKVNAPLFRSPLERLQRTYYEVKSDGTLKWQPGKVMGWDVEIKHAIQAYKSSRTSAEKVTTGEIVAGQDIPQDYIVRLVQKAKSENLTLTLSAATRAWMDPNYLAQIDGPNPGLLLRGPA